MSIELVTQSFRDQLITPHGATEIAAKQISGLILPDGRRYFSRHLNLGVPLHSCTITLPDTQTERLASFYRDYLTKEPPDNYEAFSFLGYIQGWDNQPDTDKVANRLYDWDEPIPAENLESGKPYIAVDEGREAPLQAMLGISDTNRSLSVLAMNGPLFLMNNEAIRLAFGASALFEVTDYEQQDS